VAGWLLGVVCSHWGIENRLHWVLEMVFREDECHLRKGSATGNLASLRHIAPGTLWALLRRETSVPGGPKTKRLKVGWSDRYLEQILMA
jgi:predicted transposase YbfD/YdcC